VVAGISSSKMEKDCRSDGVIVIQSHRIDADDLSATRRVRSGKPPGCCLCPFVGKSSNRKGATFH
jgi:hypothetical protein